jgi:hypothetical protein
LRRRRVDEVGCALIEHATVVVTFVAAQLLVGDFDVPIATSAARERDAHFHDAALRRFDFASAVLICILLHSVVYGGADRDRTDVGYLVTSRRRQLPA